MSKRTGNRLDNLEKAIQPTENLPIVIRFMGPDEDIEQKDLYEIDEKTHQKSRIVYVKFVRPEKKTEVNK